MIEEIKDKTWYRDNNDGKFYNCCKVGDDRTPIIKIDDLFKILDNQPDYKSAWNELKKVIWKLVDDEKREDKFWAKRELKNNIDDSMQELEQKYNLGGE